MSTIPLMHTKQLHISSKIGKSLLNSLFLSFFFPFCGYVCNLSLLMTLGISSPTGWWISFAFGLCARNGGNNLLFHMQIICKIVKQLEMQSTFAVQSLGCPVILTCSNPNLSVLFLYKRCCCYIPFIFLNFLFCDIQSLWCKTTFQPDSVNRHRIGIFVGLLTHCHCTANKFSPFLCLARWQRTAVWLNHVAVEVFILWCTNLKEISQILWLPVRKFGSGPV